jgi:hypothetical protein
MSMDISVNSIHEISFLHQSLQNLLTPPSNGAEIIILIVQEMCYFQL